MQKKIKWGFGLHLKGNRSINVIFHQWQESFSFFFLLMTPTPDKSTMLDLSTIKNILCPYHICISRFLLLNGASCKKVYKHLNQTLSHHYSYQIYCTFDIYINGLITGGQGRKRLAKGLYDLNRSTLFELLGLSEGLTSFPDEPCF